MNETVSLNEIIDFAIRREINSVRFYMTAAENRDCRKLRKLLLELAETVFHNVRRLQSVKSVDYVKGKSVCIPASAVKGYLVDMKPKPDMDHLQALFFSIMRSETSHKLYSSLAKHVDRGDLDSFFEGLAQTEEELKKRLESKYDECLLQEHDYEAQ